MGLLDFLNSEEGRMGLGLLAAAGPRTDGMGFGGRVQEAMNGQDAWRKAQEEAKYRKMQIEEAQLAAAEKRQAQEQARRNQEAVRGAFSPMAGGAAMSNGQGPTLGNAANIGQMPQFDPRKFLAQNPQADVSALEQAMKLNQTMNPAKKLMTVAPGSFVLDEGNPTTPLFSAPDKADKPPSSVQEYQFAKDQGYEGTFEQWDTSRRRAGASNVSVNTGQKGLDNTLKLRSDFRSEPIYKAHQEVQSAYSQIQQSLKMASPVGDLAGATKIMKLLDPGSVVRESELGMAMAASGAMDRLNNYASNVINGTKLTPTQRVDFQRLADALYAESGKQYNGKRSEYQGIAERNGLSTADVLGAEVKTLGADKPKAAQTFDSKPPAHQFKDKFVTSPDGKRYRSDGLIWKEVK